MLGLQQRLFVPVGGNHQSGGVGRKIKRERPQPVFTPGVVNLAGGAVNHMQHMPGGIEIAVAIEPVPRIINHPRRIAGTAFHPGFFGGLGPLGIALAERDRQPASVGRPRQGSERAFRELRQGVCLPPGQVQHEDLRPSFFALSHKGESGAIGRKPGLPIFAAGGEWAGIASPGRHHPEVGDVLVLVSHMLPHKHNRRAIGGDLRIGDTDQAVEVCDGDQPALGRAGCLGPTGGRTGLHAASPGRKGLVVRGLDRPNGIERDGMRGTSSRRWTGPA